MRAQRIKREGAEKVYMTFKNGEAYQLLPGTPVCVDFATDADGCTVKTPADANVNFFVGVVGDKTIGTSGNNDQYGEILKYGYAAKIRINGLSTIAPGSYLKILAGSSTMRGATVAGASTDEHPDLLKLLSAKVIAGTTQAASAGLNTNIIGFVRGL